MTLDKILARYNYGPVKFTGNENALYERHLIFDQVIPVASATRHYFDFRQFSSGDFVGALAEYAKEIWRVEPCPVETGEEAIS